MRTPKKRREREQILAIPLFALPLTLLILLLLAVGAVRILEAVNGSEVVVLATSVAAGHYLQESDLRAEQVDGYTVDEAATVKAVDDAVGHVTLHALTGGHPLDKADITDLAAPGDVGQKASLRFRTEDLTISDVKTGQQVLLLFAPVGVAGAPQARGIKAILIAHPEDGGDGVVWVAIDVCERKLVLGRLARSRLIIAPVGPSHGTHGKTNSRRSKPCRTSRRRRRRP